MAALVGGLMRDVLAGENHAASILPDDAGQQIDHGCLAGTIRADDTERLPLDEGDAQVVDHLHAAVRLREVLGFEYDRHRSTLPICSTH
jgi:hypothetical protein